MWYDSVYQHLVGHYPPCLYDLELCKHSWLKPASVQSLLGARYVNNTCRESSNKYVDTLTHLQSLWSHILLTSRAFIVTPWLTNMIAIHSLCIYLSSQLMSCVSHHILTSTEVCRNTLAGTPSEKLERKYSELSNFHKIWNIVLTVNDHIEKKNVQIKVSLAFKRLRSLWGLLIFPRGVITVADQCGNW